MLGQRAILLIAALVTLMLPTAMATTAGCGKTPILKSGRYTMTVNGKQRQWILTLPNNYSSNTAYKFIFGLHWRGGSYQDVANGGYINSYYGVQALANNTAIFAAPDGLNQGWANQGGEDITFMQQIMKQVDADLCINEKLRFSMGWSYGGAMSYSLACTLPNDFRAVGVFSGASLSGCNGGTQPVAYYAQHGITDDVLNISLGKQIRDTFVRNNKCASQNPPEPSRGSRTHITTQYSGCTAGYPVWWTAFDGGHNPIPYDGGDTNKDLSWTGKNVWSFFSQFS